MSLSLEPLPRAEYAAWRVAAFDRRARARAVLVGGDVERSREQVERSAESLLPADGPSGRTEVLVLARDRRRRGGFAILWESDTLAFVFDLVLEDPTDGPAVRELVEARVAREGATALGIRRVPDDPASATFVSDEFAVVATQMALDLSASGSDDSAERLRARPMTEEELARYFENAVEEFADETMAADPLQARADAVASSQRMYDSILPQGIATPGHDFLVGLDRDDGRRVGLTWLFHEDRAGFVYDVVVDEAERGRGYGRALMDHAAAYCRSLGLDVLALNVFGHNHLARALYDALGYTVVDEVLQEHVTTPGTV